MQQNNETEGGGPIDYWLVSDRVLLFEDGRVHEQPASLGIHQGVLAAVLGVEATRGGGAEGQVARRHEEIIDVGSQPVVPGFVNAHTHLALAPLRGITSIASRAGNVVNDVFFQVERHLTAADVQVFTRLGAFEGILHGVCEVWDHYYFGEAVAEALVEAGVTGTVAPTLQDLSGPGALAFEEQLAATETIGRSPRLRDAGVRAAVGPHASDTVSNALFGRAAELARKEGLPLHLHLAQAWGEMESVQGRFTAGGHSHGRLAGGLGAALLGLLPGLPVLMAHGLFLSRDECEGLANAGWVLGYCPNSQMQFGFLSPLRAWVDAGGRFALGTDCVASNDALDVQRELAIVGGDAALSASFSAARGEYLEHGDLERARELEEHRVENLRGFKVAGPEQLLSCAWGGALAALQPAQPRGVVPGARANFLILQSDHPALFPGDDLVRTLAYGSTSAAIDWAVIGGRTRGRKEGLRRSIVESEIYRETLSEARRRRDELLVRAKIREAPWPS